MNKSYIHCLLKANINLVIKLKIFTSSGYPYATDFRSKKAKYNVNLLLLLPITNFIQLMPLCHNFYKKKSKNRLSI